MLLAFVLEAEAGKEDSLKPQRLIGRQTGEWNWALALPVPKASPQAL